MITSQQSYRYSEKSPLAREFMIVIVPYAEHFADGDHSGQRAGERHRDNDLFFWRDAAIFSRGRILSDRTKLISPLRLPQINIDDKAHHDRKQKRDIEWNISGNEREELIQLGYLSCLTYGSGLHQRITGLFKEVLCEISDKGDRDEVEHDRVDHLV